MGQYKKLGKNVALITLGNFGSKILTFLLIPLYTAVLTTEQYGTADLMTATVNLLSPFFTLLMSEAVMRFVLDKTKDKSQIFTVGLTVTLLGFLAMLLFSPLILLSKDIKPYFWYFIIYYLLTTLNILAAQFVKGIEKVGVYSLSGVLQTICFISLNLVFLLWMKLGVEGYLLALILSNLFATVFLWLGAKLYRYLLNPKKIDKKLVKDMLVYAVPMIPNSLSWWVSNSSDKYLLTFFSGVGVMGVYSVSQRIPSMFSTITVIFIGAWQISAIEDFGSEKSRKFYSNIYNQYAVLNILLVSAFICCSKILAGFLFSNNFFEGWKYVPILLFAFLFNAISAFLGTIYTSAKKTKMLFVSTVIAAVANIVFNCLFIPVWGAMGAGIATFVSYFLIWIIRLIDTKKIIRLEQRLKAEILSYVIITAQIILVLFDNTAAFAVAVILFAVLCVINRSFLKQILQMAGGIFEKFKVRG